MRVGCGAHDTYAVSAERIVHRSTSKMTAVDQPNSSTPSIACRWAEQALVLHREEVVTRRGRRKAAYGDGPRSVLYGFSSTCAAASRR